MKRFLFIILLSNTLVSLIAAKRDFTDFWQDKDGIIKAQTELTLELVDQILDEEKPTIEPPSSARKAALYLMDQILHDTRLDGLPIIADFLDRRMKKVLNDFTTPLEEGMKVYKLYNDGWIVRTPSVTIGWDIYRGAKLKDSERSLMSDSIASELSGRCDILFLTHNHGDHVDPYVVECFLENNKPVIATEEILPSDIRIQHIRKPQIWKHEFKTANGVALPTTVLPGHQDHLQNNIYIITTPEGYNVCSTGDQWLKEDFDWVLNLNGKVPAVDVLMPICWAARLPEFCQSFGAKAVLTGHENELGHHSIDHREAYWLSYKKLENFPIPNSLMTWGECFHYK